MDLKPGQIVKNLIPAEAVKINKVHPLGSMVSITYTGINTNIENTKVIDAVAVAQLEIISQEGAFNFQGDPYKFLHYAEAERIHSAYQFDPLFAVNCSVVALRRVLINECHANPPTILLRDGD
ncbi:hypothetical protein JW964_18525, partial [candidate division KSB1 bacterium]|nr:hypothetical protein [candidate division KSB1 bacterium]